MNSMSVVSYDAVSGMLHLHADDTGRDYAVHMDHIDALVEAPPDRSAPTPPPPTEPTPAPDVNAPLSGMEAPDAPGAPDGPPLDPATPPEPPYHYPSGEHRET